MKISGIYKITCLPTGKFYIGSSKNIESRWKSHKSALEKNNHSNSYLQNAWNKYGKDSFIFEIVEKISGILDNILLEDILLEREQCWLDETQCYCIDIGFNLSCIATNGVTLEVKKRVIDNKKQLLELAKSGENRPTKRNHSLGECLCFYTNCLHGSYDEEFTNQIKELRPDWFISRSDLANEKKQQLLELAKKGENRPHSEKHPLGMALSRYTNIGYNSYDNKFDEIIRKLRPDWFFLDSINLKKEQMLQMARNGEDKPICRKHELGLLLSYCTTPKRKYYDSEFDKQIKELRPDWFIDTVVENKKHLLIMAKNGEEKPIWHSKLGISLRNYVTNNSSYDPEFDKQIRELRPDWFESSINKNKKILFELAKSGVSKPLKKTSIGRLLSDYTREKSSFYDPEFHKQIKELRPDWFKK